LVTACPAKGRFREKAPGVSFVARPFLLTTYALKAALAGCTPN
jgi:hypothetical protein